MSKLLSLSKFIFRRSFEVVLFASSPAVYCSLLNIWGFLSGSNTKFSYERITQSFFVREGDIEKSFSEKETNYFAFAGGISSRRKYMANTYLLDQIDFCAGDTIIDCGANIGDLYLCFESSDLQVNYIGIEPSPREFYHLQKNVPAGKHFNLGLWKEDSELKFFVSSRRADSSFILPESFTQELTIPARRLESVVPVGQIKLLKLEAEGAEFEVIQGAGSLLERIEYIAADLGELSGGKSTLPHVVNYLLDNNFEIADFGFHRTVVLFKNRLRNRALNS